MSGRLDSVAKRRAGGDSRSGTALPLGLALELDASLLQPLGDLLRVHALLLQIILELRERHLDLALALVREDLLVGLVDGPGAVDVFEVLLGALQAGGAAVELVRLDVAVGPGTTGGLRAIVRHVRRAHDTAPPECGWRPRAELAERGRIESSQSYESQSGRLFSLAHQGPRSWADQAGRGAGSTPSGFDTHGRDAHARMLRFK